MVKLLARLFIKDSNNYSSQSVRNAYGVLCGFLGIALNLLLFAGKYIAGLLSGSVAITADAFNNLSDAGSSVVSIIGFRLAGQKPDVKHPFGHGRIEYVSGLAVVFMILLMGVELLKSSIEKIISPEPVQSGGVVIAILVLSILTKGYMAIYNRSVGAKINSLSLKAVAVDCFSDIATTTIVLISTVLSHFISVPLDGWGGVLVSGFILFSGIRSGKEIIDALLGQPASAEFLDSIRAIVFESEEIIDIHDLIVHDYGPGRKIVTLHAEVPEDCGFSEIHDVIDNIERKLKERLGCEAVIHMDPIAVNDELTNSLKYMIAGIARSLNENVSIHDFRIVHGPTHTNLIFDIVLPYDLKMSDSAAIEYIKSEVAKKSENCYLVVNVDRSFVA